MHSWLGWHRRIRILMDLIQFSESNGPELNPNYAILEEIYGTWLHKHGVLQINTLNIHVTQMTCRFDATGLTLTDIYWEVFLWALFSLMEINDKVAQRSAPPQRCWEALISHTVSPGAGRAQQPESPPPARCHRRYPVTPPGKVAKWTGPSLSFPLYFYNMLLLTEPIQAWQKRKRLTKNWSRW